MGGREGFQRPETLSHRGSRPRPRGTSRGDSKSKDMGRERQRGWVDAGHKGDGTLRQTAGQPARPRGLDVILKRQGPGPGSDGTGFQFCGNQSSCVQGTGAELGRDETWAE